MGDRGKMTGEWLAHCQACSVPEFACVFNRSGIRYDIVTGYLSDELAWKEIAYWVDAAASGAWDAYESVGDFRKLLLWNVGCLYGRNATELCFRNSCGIVGDV